MSPWELSSGIVLKWDITHHRSSLARIHMGTEHSTKQMTSSLWWWMVHGPWGWPLPSFTLGRLPTLSQLQRVSGSPSLASCAPVPSADIMNW